jgi:hypothetical protein
MMEDERALQALLDPLVPEAETVCEWDDVLLRAEQITKDGSSQRPVTRHGFGPRRSRHAVRRLAVAVSGAAALAVVVFAAVAFWPGSGGGGTLVQRALAAVGTGEVLHVVTEQSLPPGWYKPVSLPSGQPIEVTQRQEIWFDQSRDLKKTVTTLNGLAYEQLVETPQGEFTPGGPVYTCAWIAAHRIEATKARVSCNASGQNGTKPHKVPEQPPTLDLALAGFVDHYQSALASGEATKTGTGQVDGHQVIWLRIDATPQSDGGYPAEDVAIDASTYAPVLVRTSGPQPVQFKVTEIDTQAYEPSLFTRPARVYGPTSGRTEGTSPIGLAQAPALLGGTALWLGQTWNGYQLVKVEQQDLVTGYTPQSGKQSVHSVGVLFTYAPPGSTADSADVLQIGEATQCEDGWGMHCALLGPTEGVLLLDGPFYSSFTVRNGIYIAITQKGSQSDPVAVANALQPLVGTK